MIQVIEEIKKIEQFILDIKATIEKTEKELLIKDFNLSINELFTRIETLLKLDISKELKDYLLKVKIEIEKKKDAEIEYEQEEKEPEEEHEEEHEAEQPQEEQEEKEPEEKEEKKEEAKPPKETEKNYKQNVERGSKLLFYLSFVFLGGLVFAGPLAGVFLTLFAITSTTAIILNHNADKFKWKVYEHAHKELDAANQEEIEDAEAIEKFMQNEAELDKLEERVKNDREHVRELFNEDGTPLAPIEEIYNKYGVGFYPTNGDEDPSRTNQLLNPDGHDIRHGMLYGDEKTGDGGLKSIMEAKTPEEKAKHVELFLDRNLSPDTPPAERERMRTLLLADPEKNPDEYEKLHSLYTGMSTLDESEMPYLALLSTQRGTLGEMRDDLIRRVIERDEYNAEGKRDTFLDRYGATIVKHCMLDDTMNQQKLDYILSGLDEETKHAFINSLVAKADVLEKGMNNIEAYAVENVVAKFEKVQTIENYAGIVADLSTMPTTAFATEEELAAEAPQYMSLQTFRTNTNTINATNTKVTQLVDGKSTKTNKVVGGVVNAKAPNLKTTCQTLFAEAKKVGFYEWLSAQAVHTPELERIDVTSGQLPRDKTTVALIGEFIAANPGKPEFKPLKAAYEAYTGTKTTLIAEQRRTFFNTIYQEAGADQRHAVEEELRKKGITPPASVTDEERALAPRFTEICKITTDFNKIVDLWFEEHKERFIRLASPKIKDVSKASSKVLTEARARCKAECKQLITVNKRIADMDAYERAWVDEFISKEEGPEKTVLATTREMIDSGEIADMKIAEAENEALGIDGTDIDNKINTSAEKVASYAGGAINLEDILKRCPEQDRDELRKEIVAAIEQHRIDTASDPSKFNPRKIIKEIIAKKYGATKIEEGSKTADEMIAEATTNKNYESLISFFPKNDQQELRTKISEIVETGDDVANKICDYLATKYGDRTFETKAFSYNEREKSTVEAAGGQYIAPTETFTAPQLFAQWLKKGVSAQTDAVMEKVIARGAREMTCYGSTLGKNFAQGLFEESTTGEKPFDSQDNPLDYMTDEEREAEEEKIKILENTKTEFNSAWRKAVDKKNPNYTELKAIIIKPTGLNKKELAAWQERYDRLVELGIDVIALEDMFKNGSENRLDILLTNPYATASDMAEAEAEFNAFEAWKDKFLEAWKEATDPTNPNLDKLIKLVIAPTASQKGPYAAEYNSENKDAIAAGALPALSTKDVMRVFRERKALLTKMGIDVDKLAELVDGYIQDKTRLENSNLSPEERKTLEENQKKRFKSIALFDKTFNVAQAAREFVGKKLVDFETCKLMHNEDVSLQDIRYIRAASDARRVQNDITNVTGKYHAILSLKGKYGEDVVKDILQNFKVGNLLNLATLTKRYPELKFIHFSKGDVDAIKRLGLEDKITSLDPKVVRDHVEKLIDEQKRILEELESQSRDQRIDPTRKADLETSKRRRGLLARLRKVRNMLGNIKTTDESKKKLGESEAELHPTLEAEVVTEVETGSELAS